MEKEFIIRSYGYGELAMLYFPNSMKRSATVQLRRWIKLNKNLQNSLLDVGFKPGQKLLTPKQVIIIVDFLGNP
jgi:hypothetical protein